MPKTFWKDWLRFNNISACKISLLGKSEGAYNGENFLPHLVNPFCLQYKPIMFEQYEAALTSTSNYNFSFLLIKWSLNQMFPSILSFQWVKN